MRQCLFAIFFIILFTGALSAQNLKVIASFTTSVAGQDSNVKQNIFIACRKLNGHVIQPKTIFSFNKVVGEGSAVNGYVDGRVLYMDHVRYEPGGGLCQVSSTLYNAMLMAGFTKIERYRHFQPVTYVPLGLDATIKYGKKDLRMKNPHSQQVYISATMNDKSLLISLKAMNRIQYRYELITDEEEMVIPFTEKYNQEYRVRNGITVYVYRKKFIQAKLIESQLLYKDFYPPVKFK